ncbi:uncharacterized protein KY384_003799 [Bacidia gigantensis]|uniref:uncharacterized protein n=1 Tax=Bacidia gigantensis TaxID=2732470 RepID=UPI001D046F3F|nr:uncharacterized protein KY384_003799 [Bacidia gigantensis]KAG8532159.1 hypothetical protein KY384_003799 [Bacidia gigantensis]
MSSQSPIQPLASRDVNAPLNSPSKAKSDGLQKEVGDKPQSLDYHRQVLQNRLAEDKYLQLAIPLLLIASSFSYIIFRLGQRTSNALWQTDGSVSQERHTKKSVQAYTDDASGEAGTCRVTQDFDSDEVFFGLSESGQKHSRIQVSRPRGQSLLIAIEFLTVAVLIAASSSESLRVAHTPWTGPSSLIKVIFWCYALSLICVRLYTVKHSLKVLPNIWYQTAWLYGSQWILCGLAFRSEVIHPRSSEAQALVSSEFGLVTILALIVLTARKGNKVVLLEYEAALQPSQEPLANLFSTWTYSWVNPIVWTGWQRTLELSDVWNLEARDRAATVLADFRQLRRTNALAWHLVKYFKRELIKQAFWAFLAGFLTFAPTLLMKAFLEFVEDPAATPVNAAWFYMVLLALSNCTKSVADGQALWVGRKICIRLRAVIVGEVYAKSLRRKAATGRDTVLGGKRHKSDGDWKPREMASNVRKNDNNKNSQEAPDDSQCIPSFSLGSTPVQLVVCIGLLYRILGLSSLAGIVMMIMVLPINLLIARQFTRVQKKVMAATDVRIQSTNEILQNIRIIKYFAWEQRFGHIVDEKRHVELQALRNKYILWTAAAGVWFGVPILITFFSFMLYTVVEKKPLIPSIAFTSLSLFGILRYPLDQLADMVAHVQESKVSVDRVDEFLNEDETEKYDQLCPPERDRNEHDPRIGFDNATLSWGSKDNGGSDGHTAFRMIDIEVHFRVGQLNIIAGPTGSGKTSMLMALLGEMTLFRGSVHLPCGLSREELTPHPETGLTDSIAYCAQQAWLVNDSIKENILFASPFEEARYKSVIVACALERDLEILDNGDSTLVGERGITLSGGQKQRISLARALYSTSRHVLLDDCLSAVDSHTAKHIFDFCIMGPLMFGRTCILVTHNVVLCVPRSHFVVVLANGKVAVQGSPNEVIGSGALGEEIQKSRPASKFGSTLHSRMHSTVSLETQAKDMANDDFSNINGHHTGNVKEPRNQAESPRGASPTEKKAAGSVNIQVIKMYLVAMGPWIYWVIAFAAFALQQLGAVGANVWIRSWANAYVVKKPETTSNDTTQIQLGVTKHYTHAFHLSSSSFPVNGPFWNFRQSNQALLSSGTSSASDHRVNAWHYLAVYAALGLLFILISLAREWLIFWGSLRASRRIHHRLFGAVTRARLQFFDTTPLGQLMNRFSKDVEAVDQDVSPISVGFLGCIFSIVSIIILICVITPSFLVAGFFITLIYCAIGAFYIRSSRDLKRLESIQRSPIYQHFGETLSGVVTIRAYGDERRFVRENQTRVDTHNRPFIYLWATNRWLALRVDFVGALVAFFAGVFVILAIKTIDAGSAGLSLTYAVMFTENVLWLVRLYSANEQNMNSVERIKEYMEIDQEADAIIEHSRPPSNWPSQGAISFQKYTTSYRQDLGPVLQDLTFSVLPNERVGIVGRTGAGKSSLALALFRGLEADDGQILIDDIDIGGIGLQDLREAITIVPQDPTLFTGTLRSNLDPFGLFTDEEIFATLRRVQLISEPKSDDSSSSSLSVPPVTITPPDVSDSSSTTLGNDLDLAKSFTNTRENSNAFKNLSSSIAESGSNLSQGQRQLLCLARALLKAPRVLIMDEATASIDYATDGKIQDTLREVKESTIVTIAHRLQTIIDYDKVLVLDKGRVIEYDSPWDLISREGSIFRGMCEMSGDLEVLEEAAREAANKKKLVDI